MHANTQNTIYIYIYICIQPYQYTYSTETALLNEKLPWYMTV